MAKIVLGNAPKSFPLPVKFQTPHGDGEVTFQAKHLKMSVYSKMREDHVASINAQIESLMEGCKKAAELEYSAMKAAEQKPAWWNIAARTSGGEPDKETAIAKLIKVPTESEIATLKARMAAAFMLQIFEGWDLDDTFGEPALVEMIDSYPASRDASFLAYNTALEGNRLGN